MVQDGGNGHFTKGSPTRLNLDRLEHLGISIGPDENTPGNFEVAIFLKVKGVPEARYLGQLTPEVIYGDPAIFLDLWVMVGKLLEKTIMQGGPDGGTKV